MAVSGICICTIIYYFYLPQQIWVVCDIVSQFALDFYRLIQFRTTLAVQHLRSLSMYLMVCQVVFLNAKFNYLSREAAVFNFLSPITCTVRNCCCYLVRKNTHNADSNLTKLTRRHYFSKSRRSFSFLSSYKNMQ